MGLAALCVVSPFFLHTARHCCTMLKSPFLIKKIKDYFTAITKIKER